MKKYKIPLLFIVILNFNLILSQISIEPNQEVEINVLIVYSSDQELESIENSITTNFQNVVNSSVMLSSFDSQSLASTDILIITSASGFDLPSSDQDAISSFVTSPYKSLITLTPYVNQINTSLTDVFGIDIINQTYPTGSDPESWALEVDSGFGSINSNLVVPYSGHVGVFTKSGSAQSLVSVQNSASFNPEIQQLSYPFPVLINSSVIQNQIIFGSISAIEIFPVGIQTDQLPEFNDLIAQLLITCVQYQEQLSQLSESESPSISDSDTPLFSPSSPTENTDEEDFPNSIDFRLLLIIMIISFALLIRKQIIGALKWLQEKIFGLTIAVVGSLYNVRNRYLDVNQVLISQNRIKILNYLEFLTNSGAHFREIQHVTNLGTGILLWHLQVLEEFSLITNVKIGRYNVYFASEYSSSIERTQLRLLMKFQSKHAEKFCEVMTQIEPIDQVNISEFAKMSEINRKSIKKLLGSLETEGLIKLKKTKNDVKIEEINKVEIMKLLKRLRMKDDYLEKISNND